MLDGPEYAPEIQRGGAPSKKVPVCSSQSVRAGDAFCVIQVGTVGEAHQEASQDGQAANLRVSVQHAALVNVRPANGSMERMEVFTAEQIRPGLGQVQWKRSGLPPMNPREVRQPTTMPMRRLRHMHC